MQVAAQVHLSDVQSVYSGPEGRLWELLMGEQIHIGGMQSSLDLARRAGIAEGMKGVDLCCASGAGMRFLLRFCKVTHMTGVDATQVMLDLARDRVVEEELAPRTTFIEADVCATGLPARAFDFVWGEDAWCYVEDKPHLVSEAVRIVKPGGAVAFTDWMEGLAPMVGAEAVRCLGFMKFPSLLRLDEYCSLFQSHDCDIQFAHDTGRFAGHMPLYLDMIEKQLTYDALKIIGFDQVLAARLTGEMRFMQSLAQSGKIIQGLVVARKRS